MSSYVASILCQKKTSMILLAENTSTSSAAIMFFSEFVGYTGTNVSSDPSGVKRWSFSIQHARRHSSSRKTKPGICRPTWIGFLKRIPISSERILSAVLWLRNLQEIAHTSGDMTQLSTLSNDTALVYSGIFSQLTRGGCRSLFNGDTHGRELSTQGYQENLPGKTIDATTFSNEKNPYHFLAWLLKKKANLQAVAKKWMSSKYHWRPILETQHNTLLAAGCCISGCSCLLFHLHNILTYSSARALERPSNMPAAKLEIATIINATAVDSFKSLRQPSRLAKPMGTVSSQSLGTKACCFWCASWTRERKSTTTCKFSSASSIMEMCPECGNLSMKTMGRLGTLFDGSGLGKNSDRICTSAKACKWTM